MTTLTKYFGVPSSYPNITKQTSSDEGERIRADVIFEELVNNKVFIRESEEAIMGVSKNPDKFPNLSLKYKKILSD